MLESYKTVYIGGTGEIIEKKSRFIATVQPIKNEEEAEEFIMKIRKQYWDASHNCYAYAMGNNYEIQRYSDDKEPNNTAGKPILDVILGEEIKNCVIVVTRYFGGTLLGTGGLIRAYSKAAKEGLLSSTVAKMNLAKNVHITISYNEIGKIQYISAQLEIVILNAEYTDNVKLELLIPTGKEESYKKQIIEATGGKVVINELAMVYYSNISGEIKIFGL